MRCTYDNSTGRFSECDGHGRHHRSCPDARPAELTATQQLALNLTAHAAPDDETAWGLAMHLLAMPAVTK